MVVKLPAIEAEFGALTVCSHDGLRESIRVSFNRCLEAKSIADAHQTLRVIVSELKTHCSGERLAGLAVKATLIEDVQLRTIFGGQHELTDAQARHAGAHPIHAALVRDVERTIRSARDAIGSIQGEAQCGRSRQRILIASTDCRANGSITPDGSDAVVALISDIEGSIGTKREATRCIEQSQIGSFSISAVTRTAGSPSQGVDATVGRNPANTVILALRYEGRPVCRDGQPTGRTEEGFGGADAVAPETTASEGRHLSIRRHAPHTMVVLIADIEAPVRSEGQIFGQVEDRLVGCPTVPSEAALPAAGKDVQGSIWTYHTDLIEKGLHIVDASVLSKRQSLRETHGCIAVHGPRGPRLDHPPARACHSRQCLPPGLHC